jgi:kumamolisin
MDPSRIAWFTVCLLIAASSVAAAPAVRHGTIIIPRSSIFRPEDAGKRAHTNVEVAVAPGEPNATPGGFWDTPASIGCVYHLTKAVTGCNPTTLTANPTGGFGTIILIDAYDDPNAASDLAAFDSEFGLPAANFQVMYENGVQPSQDPTGGWEFEESVDVQMAHAMAPRSKIILFEAQSSSFGDLFTSVGEANAVFGTAGGSMSMSWGSGEFNGENGYDGYWVQPNVIYFAAIGDAPGVSYPAASPDVVAVGGTTFSRNATTGNFELESAWYSTGGGPSQYESIPSYQSSISSIVGTQRGTPDVAAIADGRTPVWIYDSIPINGQAGTWWLGSGTSVATPIWAGIVNSAGHKYASTNAELTEIYSNMTVATEFHDITQANCGNYAGYLAVKGWDFCTGVGSDVGKNGK